MTRFIALLALLGSLGVAGFLVVPVTADNGSPQTGHIGICHHTGRSQAHEWVYIEPDASGVLAGHANVNHQNIEFGQEDIIPAFVLVDAHGVSHAYAGLNLATHYDASLEPTAGGQFTGAQILAARCVSPATTTTVAATTTNKHPTTSTTSSTVTVLTPGGTNTVTVTTPGGTNTLTATTPGGTNTVTVTVTTATPPAPPPVTVTTTIPGKPGKTVTVTKTVVKAAKAAAVKGAFLPPTKPQQKPRLAHTA